MLKLDTHIENIFLYQGMKDDCNKQVEEHSGHIFRAILVKIHWLTLLLWKNKQSNKNNKNRKDLKLWAVAKET